MSNLIIPEGYRSTLNLYQTQSAIGTLKRIFEDNLSEALHLKRVSAPLFLRSQSGLNDDLNGIERPVTFSIKDSSEEAQIVHSLAKWKRMALYEYGFSVGEGLYTDMNAIRRDELMDNLHSIYVDQWDWEKVISEEQRSLDTLKQCVCTIVEAICDAQKALHHLYPELKHTLSNQVTFVTTQYLEDCYPTLTPKERENMFVKEHPTTFLMQIGDRMESGQIHDGRAPDYDDWKMNGDLLFWNEVLQEAFEVSSMGIRVDAQSLHEQLVKAECVEREKLPFHRMLLSNTLPFTMGGGIGQSRLCMLLLEKAHIGEVQVSLWDEKTVQECMDAGISLL